ncbi:MAG: protein-glutamate O-methyltransferase CheR [Gemmatimonadota bacterium]|nr:MAG: protein-glutamate O-methyltransferase CheR [Gemmatimonadota bacterium]
MKPRERDPDLVALLEKISEVRGFCGNSYKEGCLRRRIAVRMRARGVHTYEQYAQVLDGDADEYDRLLDTITINVTKFFRNRETWQRLEAEVLPDLWTTREGRVRCWSAGCASGEEPYTLAILFLELVRALPHAPRGGASIDATDLDRTSLAHAAEGVYRPAAFDEMPAALVSRYVRGDDPRHLAPEVKEMVRFHQHDLLRSPPPHPPYDLVMCRNVVIYFDRPTQEQLFRRFVDALHHGGYLVLGKVETLVGEVRQELELVDARERIYRRP